MVSILSHLFASFQSNAAKATLAADLAAANAATAAAAEREQQLTDEAESEQARYEQSQFHAHCFAHNNFNRFGSSGCSLNFSSCFFRFFCSRR
jgi:hypothetical protein